MAGAKRWASTSLSLVVKGHWAMKEEEKLIMQRRLWGQGPPHVDLWQKAWGMQHYQMRSRLKAHGRRSQYNAPLAAVSWGWLLCRDQDARNVNLPRA